MLAPQRIAWLIVVVNGASMIALMWRWAFGPEPSLMVAALTMSMLMAGFLGAAITVIVSLATTANALSPLFLIDKDPLALFPTEDQEPAQLEAVGAEYGRTARNLH